MDDWFTAHDDFVDSNTHERSMADLMAVVSRAFSRTIRTLRADEIRVWLFDPLPQAKLPVPETLAKRLYLGGGSASSIYADRI